MFTRRFFIWVGIGTLATLTIPTIAAPHVAKLLERRPPAQTARSTRPPAKKPATRPTARPTTRLAQAKGKDPAPAAARRRATGAGKKPAAQPASRQPKQNRTSPAAARNPHR